MQWLIVLIIFYVACATLRSNDSEHNKDLVVQKLILAYFQYQGVRSLNLIICPTQNNNTNSQILKWVSFYMTHNMPVHLWSGEDYLQEMPEPALYGPPNTFQAHKNDSYRKPLKFHLPSLNHKTGIVLFDFNCECGLNVLRWSAASEHNYFTTNRFWLMIAKHGKDINALKDEEIFLPPDSEVKVFIPAQEDLSYSLLDVYKVAANKPLKHNFVTENITDQEQLIKALQLYGSVISLREDLEDTTFNTGLVIAFPDMFTNIEDLSLRHIDTISKVNNRLTLELANKLNMRFNTHQTDNYGWHQPNGSFDGLMGRFQRYELDFGQMAIFMRLDRIALCDFVAETFRIRAGIMFRQPPLSAVANIFAMPFENDVWLSLVVLVIVTIAVFALELLLSPQQLDMNYWDCAVFVWGAMCQQGFYVAVPNRSARIIIFTTFVATLFLFTSFSANIVALLQSPSEAIHTLSDLSQSPLEIGVQDTVYNKIYFNESTDPVTNLLYHKKIAPKGDSIYMRPLVGMKKMRSGMFAYQVELQAGYQIISDTFSEPEKCGLKELEPFQLPMIAVPTRKNFPYKELFRRQLRWQREVGLMNREERKWFPQKPKCEGGVGGFVSIGITECRYALAIFGLGCVFAAAVLCVEMSANK
ncbi:hypothetical protein DOY81_007687 [Sarcophaga bullata]|nr:hypothetical protein DOY81_007687 [Sarcophaga bullata]